MKTVYTNSVQDKDQGCWKQIMVDGTRTRRHMLVGPRRLTFLFYWRSTALSVRLAIDNRYRIEAAFDRIRKIYSSRFQQRRFPFVRITRLEKRDFYITDRYQRVQVCLRLVVENSHAREIQIEKEVFVSCLTRFIREQLLSRQSSSSKIKQSRASINFTA